MNQLNDLYAAIGSSMNVTAEQRGALVELTLARKLAFALPLPSSPVDGLIKHYGDNCLSMVRNQVSLFNETFPVNTVAVMDMTYSLWSFRYYTVHPGGVDDTAALTRLLCADVGNNRLKDSLAPIYQEASKGTLAFRAEDIIKDFVSSAFGS